MAKDNKDPNPNKLKISPWLLYAGAILLFIIISVSSNSSSFSEPLKISPPKFDVLLDSAQVERVVVFNKTEGEVYLTKEALKDKRHNVVAKDMLNRPNEGPHYIFDIGNDEIFQRKLEEAVAKGNLKDFKFEPRNSWTEYFFTFLPFIIIIAIWIFIMRRMSGAGAPGGGGQLFNIGKSKAKLFDEKNDIKTTFKDVAGLEGAKEEIQEIV
nr:peptidase M41 [Flavobacterium sp.]